jgi:hypothetical protein
MKRRIKLLSFILTLSIALFLFKSNVLETGLCLRPQAKANPVAPIDRTCPYPEDGDKVQSPKRFSDKKEDDG